MAVKWNPIEEMKKKRTEAPVPVSVAQEPVQTQPIAFRPIQPVAPNNAPENQVQPSPQFQPIATLGETPQSTESPAMQELPILPGIQPEMPQMPPKPAFQPAPSLLETKQKAYDEALAAPVQKQGAAKQALFMGLQALSNIATGQNKPIEWLGNAKKQYSVDQAARELAPVQQQEQWKQAQEQRKAQIEEIKRRPEKEALARQQKFDLEAQRQIGRIQLQQQKDAAEGRQWKQVTRNGKFFKLYGDGREEPIVDPTTGQQEMDLLEAPIEQTLADGTKVFVKGGQALNAEATKNYREAVLGLQNRQFEETQKQNAIRNAQQQQAFNESRNRFTQMLELRKQAQNLQAQALASKNTDQANKAAEDAQKLDLQINNLKAAWKARIGTGGFTIEDYNELTADLP